MHIIQAQLIQMLFNIILIATFVGTFVLGYIGKNIEMGIFAACGGICMAFLKLELFKEFSGAGFTAKLREEINEVKRDLEPIKVKETEPEELFNDKHKTVNDIKLDRIQLEALDAIESSRFTFRTVSGIAKEKGFTLPSVKKALKELEKLSLVSEVAGRKAPLWSITTLGKRSISQY